MCKSMDSQQLSVKFSEYSLKHHKEDITSILRNPDENQNFSIIVHFVTLCEEEIELGGKILTDPETYLPICDKGAVLAQRCILEESSNEEDSPKDLTIKTKIHVRITALPSYSGLHRTVFPRNDDINNFLKVSGTIVKVTAPKLLEYQRDFSCSKCQNVVTVKAGYELHYIIVPPTKCINDCNNCNFKPLKAMDQCNYKDYQEIKIQEHIGMLNVGNMPQSMCVTLEDDLVDTCKPGDDVVIYGTVMRRWRPLNVDTKSDIELVLKANNIQVCNDQKAALLVTEEMKEAFNRYWYSHKYQELTGRNHILASFCPQVYGLYLVKLAIVIVLAGGVQKSDDTGCKIRGESHLLLVGDPGTGKSHLLRFASRVCTRSVLTTGVGSTTAGLTVSAVREGASWQLEAGALVLADGGICCIDEFNAIREHDRTTIHEAMEQQTISVAKAGMVTKLNTRCSILAATNPKGNYDSEVPISVNIALASPLLSRFDLVLILLDSRNPEWDELVSGFILDGGKNPFASQENHSTATSQQLETELWSLDKLQAYFSFIRSLNPLISKDANTVLSRYYQAQRMADSRNVARTTVRMLESLVRLSQGHARLMYRQEVTVQDAIVAVSLVESSMQNSALLAGTNALHTSFPNDPNDDYKRQAEIILKKLQLDDLLEQEIQKLSQLNNSTFIKLNKEASTSNNQNIIQKTAEKNLRTDFSQRLNEVLTGIKRTKDKNMYEVVKLNKMMEPPAKKKKIVGKEMQVKQQKIRTSRRAVIIDSDSENDTDDVVIKKNNNNHKNPIANDSSRLSSDSESIFVETATTPISKKITGKPEIRSSESENENGVKLPKKISSVIEDGKCDLRGKKSDSADKIPKKVSSVREKSANGPSSEKLIGKQVIQIEEKPEESSLILLQNQDTSNEKSAEGESDRIKNMFAQFRFNRPVNTISKMCASTSDNADKSKKVVKWCTGFKDTDFENLNLEESHLGALNLEKSNLEKSVMECSDIENSFADRPKDKKSISESTLNKLLKFKKTDTDLPKRKESESYDYNKIKRMASVGNKILSQENKTSQNVLHESESDKCNKKSFQSSQSIFTLEEQPWDDADLEL